MTTTWQRIATAWTVIATVLLTIVAARWFFWESAVLTGTNYYYSKDLDSMDLPKWFGTNTIPLMPDKAVLLAIEYLNREHRSVSVWDVHRIEIKNEYDAIWTYTVSLTERVSGTHKFERVKILMNGAVWIPDRAPRKDFQ